jgi:D-alanyl-D-alanine carboxypeptidase
MAEQNRVSRGVYLRRRVAVAFAALLLLAGGVVGLAQIGGDESDDTATTVAESAAPSATSTDASTDVTTVPTEGSQADPAITDPGAPGGTVGTDQSVPTTEATDATDATSTVPGTESTEDGPPTVDAAAYAVYDVSSGEWLADREGDTQLAVGSVMKLLTAYVVMENGDLTKVVTVPDLQMDPMESAIGLFEGEELPRDVLLRAMLIVSANDAAKALAIDVAGSEDAFVEMMNQTAQELGLINTVASNPVGLDSSSAHSSARDMVTLARLLMKDEAFRATVARPSAKLHDQTFPATNDLLTNYPGADGVKTGHTTDAGYCVIGSAMRDGRRIIVAVLGSSTDAARLASASTLLDWAFDQP